MNTSRMKAPASSTAEPWDTPNTDDINHDGVWSSMTSLLRDPESSPNSVDCWETLWTSDVKNEGTRTSSSAWESNPPTLPLGTMAVPVESYQVASSDTFFPSVGQYPHLPEHLSRYS